MERDQGLFGPASVTWRLHSDPTFAVGGMRALLMQALHPQAMAAVAQSGGFEAEYWGRLGRTSAYVATITYGTTQDARRMAARVRGIHRKLRGTDPFTGEVFRVDRPDLLLWVHCCEVDSLLSTALRGGMPITDAEAEQYVAEQVRAAELIGLDASDVPASRAELAAYFRRVWPELRLTQDARRAFRAAVAPPMPGWVQLLTPARPAWGGLATLAIALMPGWARRMYRLPGFGFTDRAATAALRALRAGAKVLPERVLNGPIVTEAKGRAIA